MKQQVNLSSPTPSADVVFLQFLTLTIRRQNYASHALSDFYFMLVNAQHDSVFCVYIFHFKTRVLSIYQN